MGDHVDPGDTCGCPDCDYEPNRHAKPKVTTHEQYSVIASELLKRAHDIETAKRPDYTVGDADVLKNFKAVAADTGISAEQVWIVYAKKHWDAIRAIMREPGRKYSEPPMDRFADLLNYLKLGFALYRERDFTSNT